MHSLTKKWAAAHDEYHRHPFTLNILNSGHTYPIKIAIHYTCGATSSSLSTSVQNFLTSTLDILLFVMGDDSLALMRKNGEFLMFMCDFSRMDRTHSSFLRSAIEDKFSDWSALLGQYRKEMYSAPWHLKFRASEKNTRPPVDFKQFFPESVDMLLTGEPGTSLLNSITNACVTSVILAHYCAGNPVDIPFEYAQFGLVAKNPKITNEHFAVDYLKGVFLMTVNKEYEWIRLPSFLAKYGKVLTNPTTILPQIKDPDKRARALLYYQWLGYGDMNTNWFYTSLGDLIREYCMPDKHYDLKESVDTDFVKGSWQITQTSCYIDDHEWNNFMWYRYQVVPEQMEEFLESFEQVLKSPLPCIYSHQLVTILERRDY